jgi:site-specific recombinase XerD
MFKFAASHELVKSNPFSVISKVRIESKTRFLSKIEIAKLFDSLKEEKQIYQDVVQILIYTGQRKGNVYSMESKELSKHKKCFSKISQRNNELRRKQSRLKANGRY